MKLRHMAIIAMALLLPLACKEASELFNFDYLRVDSCSPQTNESGVEPDASVRIAFNTDVDSETVEQNFSLLHDSSKLEGNFSWVSRREFIFIPRYAMKLTERYVVEIRSGVRSVDGRVLSSDFLSDFYVGTVGLRPSVVSSNPVYNYGGTTIEPGAFDRIEFVFNAPMNRVTTEAAFSISPSVSGYYEWTSDTTLIYHLTENLEYGKQYTVRIAATAEAQGGAAMARDFFLLLIAGEDFTPPDVIGISENGALPYWDTSESGVVNEVSRFVGKLYVVFTEEMDKVSAESSFSLTPSVDGFFTWETNPSGISNMVYNITGTLESEQVYQVSVESDAKDLHGLHMDDSHIVVLKTTASDSQYITVGKVWGSNDGITYEEFSSTWPVLVNKYLPDEEPKNNMKYYIKVQFLQNGAPVAMDKTSLFGNHDIQGFDAETTSRVKQLNWITGSNDSEVAFYFVGLAEKTPPEVQVLYRFTLNSGANGIKDSNGNTMKEDYVLEFRSK